MESISLYLLKFKNLGVSEKRTKETIIRVIKNELGFEIEKDLIIVRDNEVRIKVTGPLKSELFMRKDSIQKQIESSLGTSHLLK